MSKEKISYDYYYDETEHSRKITLKTVESDNFYHSFSTAIVGCETDNVAKMNSDYAAFETKYKYRADKHGEIKSKTLGNQKQTKYGFASMPKGNKEFILDYLKLVEDNNLVFYFSFENKFDLIVRQLFDNSISLPFSLVYSLSKLITLYNPTDVIKVMLSDSINVTVLFKTLYSFFDDIISRDANNEYKRKEYEACLSLKSELMSLESKNDLTLLNLSIDWLYYRPFVGLIEHGCDTNSSLYIDHEGEYGEISSAVEAARTVGFKGAIDADSVHVAGLRIADIMAGLIMNFTKAIHNDLVYIDISDGLNRKLLSRDWFDINDLDFELYGRISRILHNNCFSDHGEVPVYISYYPDNLITFISFIDCINSYKTLSFLRKHTDFLQNEVQSITVSNLQMYFKVNSYLM